MVHWGCVYVSSSHPPPCVITLLANPMIALAIPLISRILLIMVIRKVLDAHFESLGPRPHFGVAPIPLSSMRRSLVAP